MFILILFIFSSALTGEIKIIYNTVNYFNGFFIRVNFIFSNQDDIHFAFILFQ